MLVIWLAITSGLPLPGAAGDTLLAHHFDVGQGDMTLVQAGGCNVLIDAGRWDRDDVLEHLAITGVGHIHIVIATHPHADHIGQLDEVLAEYPVSRIWRMGWEHDSQTYRRVSDAVDQVVADTGATEEHPRAGDWTSCGGLDLRVVHPIEPLEDIHDNLSVRIEHEHVTLLYTGDAEARHERERLKRGEALTADFLHLGHHGSRTSTTSGFLRAVDPDITLYSAGRDNTYGHPHDEVIERIRDHGTEIYGTAEHGTVVLEATADGIAVHTARDDALEEFEAAGTDCSISMSLQHVGRESLEGRFPGSYVTIWGRELENWVRH